MIRDAIRERTARRVARSKAGLHGTSLRPRLCVNITNLHVTAQLIDDDKSVTIASSSSAGQKIEGSKLKKAEWVGADIAKKAFTAKIKTVVFDRNGRKYHGRVKALADAARESGLEF